MLFLERRISIELDNVHMQNDNNVNREMDTNIDSVQSAYEKTLETASLSPSTDQLARRLSRELKIRRSAEHKIIRSGKFDGKKCEFSRFAGFV